MQATNRIRDKTKPLLLTETSAPTYSSNKTYQVPVTNSCANTFFSHLSSSITRTVTLKPQPSEEKQTRLMKKSRCFSYKKKDYIAYDCPKKEEIAAISESISKDSNSQGKK